MPAKRATLPAPTGGLNVTDPSGALKPDEACLLVNLIAGARGLHPRAGTIEHVTNLGSPSGAEVRSIIPYQGVATPLNDRLFAAVTDGIYNCTTPTTTPTRVRTFPSATADSGRGSHATMVTAAGGFLAFADETNGFQLYTESSDTWAAGSVTGVVSAADLVHVISWKGRWLFIERNTANMVYLAAGAISGAATRFNMGQVFKRGGQLRSMHTWTRDGGSGIDDLLVLTSTGGEVLVYQGTDPSSANTFSLVGSWYVGGFPPTRRLAAAFGGDLLLMTNLGVIPLGRLVTGQPLSIDAFATRNIQPLYLQMLEDEREVNGWGIMNDPTDATVIVMHPWTSEPEPEQFAMSYATRGWCQYRGIDMLSAGSWSGEFYIGTRDGRVLRQYGSQDNVDKDGGILNASPITCIALWGFNASTPNQKQIRLAKAKFITDGENPGVTGFARYDYDLTEPTISAAPPPSSGAVWDTGVWDSDLWGLGTGQYAPVFANPTGIGSAAAFGLVISATGNPILVGAEVTWEEGGLL